MGDDTDTEKSTQDLWDQIEKTPHFRWMSEAGKMFKTVRDLAEQRGERELALQAQFEIEIHHLGVSHPFINKDYRQRFAGMFGHSDGTEWPCLEGFSPEQFDHYEHRLHDTANPFLKCRYADVLFECHPKGCRLTRLELGMILVHLLQETGTSHLNQSEPEYPLCLFDIARAADVSIRLHSAELLTPVIKRLMALSQSLDGKRLRWVYEISRIMRGVFSSPLGATVSNEVYAALVRRVDEARAFFLESEELLMWHRNFCKELVAWGRLLPWAEVDLANYQREIGESYEREATIAVNQYGSNIMKAVILEDALRHYEKIGAKEKRDKLKVLVRQAYAASKAESCQIHRTMKIPIEEIEKRLSQYKELSVANSLCQVASDEGLVVDLASVEEQTADDKDASPFEFEIPKFVLDDDRKVFAADSDCSRFQYLANINYKTKLLINAEALLKAIFRVLIEQRGMEDQDVIGFLRRWPPLDERNAAILTVGIERFFARDYVSALHVLVPQFECCLRRMFAQAGYPTTTSREGGTQYEQPLGSFLKQEDVKSALGPNFHKYVEMVMVDQTGFNLRNDVAHGLIRPEECNETNTLMVIHLFLILTQCEVEPRQPEQ
ncbi:MAG: DUF4209 domain-containing protein [Desulfomonile tiedjei]|nr:DUF4209 domain-containing protein [Desulfomonile tiedjei]